MGHRTGPDDNLESIAYIIVVVESSTFQGLILKQDMYSMSVLERNYLNSSSLKTKFVQFC